MPNVMAALPSVQCRKVWLTLTNSVAQLRCQDAKPDEISWGAPNSKAISAVSGPKFAIL